MLTIDYLDAFTRERDALNAAVEAGLDAPVPACPGWDVGDLAVHVATVYAFAGGCAETRAAPTEYPSPPERDGIGATLSARGAQIEATLRNLDDGETCWNWSDAPQVGVFWKRRMAQETVVHRFDAQSAHGRAEPIAADLAIDGIDEFCDVFVPRVLMYNPDADLGGTVHLHATDTSGEWLVEISEGTASVTREHAKGDAAVRGKASDLLLFAWNRKSHTDLETFGDTALLERWATILTI